MLRTLVVFFMFLQLVAYAQSINDSVEKGGPRYYEDQFYLGITYNFLLNRPEDVTQQNLSYGLQGGFTKDIPINYDRTLGLGLGIGFGLNTYYSNIEATELGDSVTYSILGENENNTYKRSKLETHSIEFPIEFRWRNSTAEEYKFWRVYAGVKLAYVYNMRSKFVPEDNFDRNKSSFNNPDVRGLQYGLTLNFGYNSFNAHIYYALTNLLNDDAILNQESIQMKPLRVGLIFYIL